MILDMSAMQKVEIYASGSYMADTGEGGWGAVLMRPKGRRELCGGCVNTSLSRMELFAAIMALKELREPCKVILHTHSQYVIKGMNEIEKWRDCGWKAGNGKPVTNIDLWTAIMNFASSHAISFIWIKGHSENNGKVLANCLANYGIGMRSVDADSSLWLPI